MVIKNMGHGLIKFKDDDARIVEAIALCKELGIDLTTYLRMCISKLLNEGQIPFTLSQDELAKCQEEGIDVAFLKENKSSN